MTFEEATRHVGDAVIYTRPGEPGRQGVIQKMLQLPLVRFDDGELLQVAPARIELAQCASLFGDVEWSTG